MHALGQVAHVDLERDWAPFRLSEGLNALLHPHPVAIVGAERVGDDFDARHSATARHYLYRIVNRRAPLTFERGPAWRVKPRLDAAAMHAAARVLIGRHDFSTFRDFAMPGEFADPHARPARRQARGRRGSVRGERALVPASPGALDGGLAGRGRDRALERGRFKAAFEAADRSRCGPVAPRTASIWCGWTMARRALWSAAAAFPPREWIGSAPPTTRRTQRNKARARAHRCATALRDRRARPARRRHEWWR